jgi:hypothetical protein
MVENSHPELRSHIQAFEAAYGQGNHDIAYDHVKALENYIRTVPMESPCKQQFASCIQKCKLINNEEEGRSCAIECTNAFIACIKRQ